MKLFASVELGSLEVANRIVMAPMTRNRAGPGNVATDLTATYYAQRASAGLLVTEASQISPEAVGYPNTPGIHGEAQTQAWRQVTDRVHAHGGHIFLQLWHAGRVSHPSLLPEAMLPVAPSALAVAGKAFTAQGLLPFPVPRALGTAEVGRIVGDFAEAARRARSAGFDGVELHAAHGYLIDQFLRDGSNHRSDRYGGSLTNRARFLLEIVDAVSAAWAADRIGVKLSPLHGFNDMSDSDPERSFVHVAGELARRHLAYLHLVEEAPSMADEDRRSVSAAIRKAFPGPLILNGGYTGELARQAVDSGAADLVSFGSAFIANPDLVERLRLGLPLSPSDRATYYGGTERGYTDYPALRSAARPTGDKSVRSS
jgi:N-ethylmaleimide reductase